MPNPIQRTGRRAFLRSTAALTGLALLPQCGWGQGATPEEGLHIIGPKDGYTPQVGTLVSMLAWMRSVVLRAVEKLAPEQLDYLHDATSNTIGAMLLHLAATETFYQINTFEGRPDFNDAEKKQWNAAMRLGDAGRSGIKGNDLNHYLSILTETREKTLAELRKRDDAWLMKVDPHFFANQPTNNYCKWFHVCEHESNHNGQIKWIRSRLPGANATGD